jgi:predicted alpha/beta-fold hydrolase
LEVDYYGYGNPKLVVISHGLEGNSERPYIIGMVNALIEGGYDVMAWNFRGCGSSANKSLKMYHSGATEDLDVVVQHALTKNYKALNLVGFSLGGNLTLKYLGELGAKGVKSIAKAVVFSVPLDLRACASQIKRSENIIYSTRFLISLKKKIKAKAKQFPGQISLEKLSSVNSVYDFDEHYTAPIHGFDGAEDYYQKCSSIYFIKSIQTPTLVVNALNDPFLADRCFDPIPFEEHPNVNLELPKDGGHCGFPIYGNNGRFWSEERALLFLQSN